MRRFQTIPILSAILVMISGLTINETRGNETRVNISAAALKETGTRIWKNECAGTLEGLTSWNTGEDFPSLGIGHFIWYPTGKSGRFEESFPGLINFLQKHRVKIPNWLAQAKGAPWPTREVFLQSQNTAQMRELRQLLANTVDLQTLYIVERLQAALPEMKKEAPRGRANHVEQQFRRLAATPQGMYCLIDYVNFKGEGTSPTERYRGEGWGLLQVLNGMPGNTASATSEFSASAAAVLTRRVQNSPSERNEKRWLQGWLNRTKTYR